MKPIIILDLDNCISDDAWRIPHIDWTQQDKERRYHAYHCLSNFDVPANLDVLHGRGEKSVLVFTARPEAFRIGTEEWLRRAGVPVRKLLMRFEGNRDPSPELKALHLDYARRYYGVPLSQIDAAYDDRPEVLSMYRAAGLRAVQLKVHDVCAFTPPKLSGE